MRWSYLKSKPCPPYSTGLFIPSTPALPSFLNTWEGEAPVGWTDLVCGILSGLLPLVHVRIDVLGGAPRPPAPGHLLHDPPDGGLHAALLLAVEGVAPGQAPAWGPPHNGLEAAGSPNQDFFYSFLEKYLCLFLF